MAEAQRLEGLDALRGIAASAVVFCHVVFIGGFPVPPVLLQPAEHATLAVPLFFVLSAFSLCVGYHHKLEDRRQVSHYFLRRFLRIAPLFYFMMALWLIFYGWKDTRSVGTGEILANLTFIFGTVPEWYLSIVPAGWSIGIEMLFYVLFPIALMIVRTWRTAAAALVLALAVGVTLFELTPPSAEFGRLNLLTEMPFFAAGILAYFCYRELAHLDEARRKRLSRVLLGATAALWLVAGLLNDPLDVSENYVWRYSVAAGFPLIVLAIALYPVAWIANRVTIFLGALSFSIYLLHPLIIILIKQPLARLVRPRTWDEPWVPIIILLVVVYALVVAASSLTYRLIERPMMRLGSGRRRAPAAIPAVQHNPAAE